MGLQHETSTTEEPRYDSEMLKKVTALAQALQHRDEQSFTPREMEEIGVEAGLGRAFIRRALAQLSPAAKPAAAAPASLRAGRPRGLARLAAQPLKQRQILTATWWATAWMLPMIGALLSLLVQGGANLIPLGFFALLGLYLGPGIFFSLLARKEVQARPDPEETTARALMAAWWGAGWTLPLAGVGLGLLLSSQRAGIPLCAMTGLMLYIGNGVRLSMLARREPGDPARPDQPELSRAKLLEVLFAIQHALEAEKQHRAFLSIDVVDSSRMKLEASDLAVEHSFGQLHRWLAEVVRACGGELHSAAGDGMMCLFSDETQALRAARRIQEGIDRFNREQNRLGTPFGLRCGVSAGEIGMEPGMPLGSVQSAVIDRAAALQRRAEPGGVVVGSEALSAAQAELGSLIVLAEPVAGSPAFLWPGVPAPRG